jgi:predicted nucleic acid-binding Zn ribbon protein
MTHGLHCVVCHKPLTASQRQCCSHACVSQLARAALAAARAQRARERPCPICGAPRRFARRKTCSASCGQRLAWQVRKSDRSAIDHPPCTRCGGEVVRRPGERHYRWLLRRSCCHPRLVPAIRRTAAVVVRLPAPRRKPEPPEIPDHLDEWQLAVRAREAAKAMRRI